MEPLLFPTTNLSESDVQSISGIYHALKKTWPVTFATGFNRDIKQFDSFGNREIGSLGPVICLNKNSTPAYLTFIQFNYKLQTSFRGTMRDPDASYTEGQTWGMIFLKEDYGHVLIRPERMADRICELISHQELNFEDDKEFNRKFHVLTNDEAKARSGLTPHFRDCLRDIQVKDFVIEIMGNSLIMGDNKIIQQETAITMAGFLDRLSRAV
jgi:hypothetical protein